MVVGKTLIGKYYSEIEAYAAYVVAKEASIHELGNKYRNQLPDFIYTAIMNWRVEKIESKS